VNSSEFNAALEARANLAGLDVSTATVSLFGYFELLRRWNKTINLTALPLDSPGPETFDRLFIEPLSVAARFPDQPLRWFDLGSGGGSPAIPIKLTRPRLGLHMVEAKERKAAFLREVIRELEIQDADVDGTRFETLSTHQALKSTIDLITVRAVRLDTNFLQLCIFLLRDGGTLVPIGFRGDALAGFARDSQSGFFRRNCST